MKKKWVLTRTGDIAVAIVATILLLVTRPTQGLRFVIDREECFSHSADQADTFHVSFVVIKSDSIWDYTIDGVDFNITAPPGNLVIEMKDKTSEKYEFVVYYRGPYRFCFKNKSPYHETIDFDIHISHFMFHDEHARNEHFWPLMEELTKLEESLYNIQFEQHWLEAQTDRQTRVNYDLNRKATQKAIVESAALVGSSCLQFYLLRRLFDRKFAY
ncbi:Transmembrane emp24 domain-containing protein p24beta2 [Linum grandiflorum]